MKHSYPSRKDFRDCKHWYWILVIFLGYAKKLKGQSIAMLSYVDPFVAILISAIILQEQMTIVQMLGGVLLLGSTFVSENKSITFSKAIKENIS